ncbi:MAG: CHASE2 domain-containing protein [Castellaniella sp.]|uniref:CHASE2 domain-containing protein n=1 Tax=Castellaniella sp. TaxID=1955812 RepID=UPI003C7525C8
MFTDARHPTGMRKRLLAEWLVLIAGLALLCAALTAWKNLPGIQDLNRRAYDLSMQAAPSLRPSDDLVIIAIDDASIDALGYWPWRRSVHAALLERLHGARAVGLDLILSAPHPTHAQDDLLLAEAIARHGRVVLPEVLSPDGHYRITPTPPLARAAAALGRIDAQPDPDGILRTIQLHRTPADGGAPLEHLSLALARVAGQDAATARARAIPADAALRIRYTDPADRLALYPYAAVLNGQVPETAFRDRIVLIGAWASGLGDHLSTPINGATAGVAILADTLQNLRDDLWIRVAPFWLTSLTGLCLILLVCLGLGTLSARWGLAAALAACILFLASDALLLQWTGYWLPPAGILAALILAYPLWSWRSEEASLSRIDTELERLRVPLRLEDPDPGEHAESSWHAGPNTLPARAIRLHQAVTRLKQATRAQEETLSFLSHDMRSPQSAILSAIELRRQTPGRWTEETVLAHIEQQALATLDLVDHFVQLGRAESAPLNRHPCDLDDLIQECCDRRWARAVERGIELRFDARHPEAAATLDTELMGRAIGNLLDNALLYSPAQSAVECTLEPAGRFWHIHVQDAGPGIPPEQMERLFLRFQRLPGDAQKPTGSGLGLAFVQTVARRHGGRAFCASTPGQGARFTISLPVDD